MNRGSPQGKPLAGQTNSISNVDINGEKLKLKTNKIYRKTSSISRIKSQNLKCFLFPLAVVFAQSIEAIC